MLQRIGAGLVLGVLAAPSVAAGPPDRQAILATVRRFAEVFSLRDPGNALAVCAEGALIIDDLPPHVWQGRDACSQWYKDFSAFVQSNAITDSRATLLKPRHVDITGDRAYVVVPINFTYKMGGKEVKEAGSIFTVALADGAQGWRITGWAVGAR